jgi:hypothetical protein
MAVNKQAPAYLCGRLYATLYALQVIGAGKSELARADNLKRAVDSPAHEFDKLLQLVGKHMNQAKGNKNTQWAKAATTLFQAIPALIPPGGIPGGNFRDTNDFCHGCTDQMCEYKKEDFASFLE